MIPVATGGDSAGSRSLGQLTVSGVIGANLADTVLATSIASGPDPRNPAALPQWPVPATTGEQLTVGFSADLGYARPDAAVADLVAGRLQALAAAGMIRLREVTVRLADPAAGWLPAGDLCWAFNLSGHPAVTVPAGLLDGLPAGLQAVAAPHRDDLAVELAGLAAVACRIRRSTGQFPEVLQAA